MELRDPEIITAELSLVRKGKFKINSWTIQDISSDILSLSKVLEKDILKLEKSNFKNQSAALRIRRYTKALEVLGVRFRTATYNI